ELLPVHEKVKSAWKELYPNRLYAGKLMNEDMEEGILHFRNVSILYRFLGAITIVLAMSGLFSMVTLHVQKRMKEMGIRKTLGAGVSSLALLAARPFLVVVAFSIAFGALGGVFSANKFMDAVWEYYNETGVEIVMVAVA